MRLHLAVMLSGLLLVAGGCSEKQKEADRMGQEVQDLEAETSLTAQEAVESAQSSGETTQIAREAVPEPSSADPSAVPPESAPATGTDRPTEAAVSQPQPEAPRPAMPPAPAGVGFTVQIASCESEDYARHLVGVYTGRGYEPFVTTITYNNLIYYRVRIGHFQSAGEARALKDELADKFSIQPWIDRTE